MLARLGINNANNSSPNSNEITAPAVSTAVGVRRKSRFAELFSLRSLGGGGQRHSSPSIPPQIMHNNTNNSSTSSNSKIQSQEDDASDADTVSPPPLQDIADIDDNSSSSSSSKHSTITTAAAAVKSHMDPIGVNPSLSKKRLEAISDRHVSNVSDVSQVYTHVIYS